MCLCPTVLHPWTPVEMMRGRIERKGNYLSKVWQSLWSLAHRQQLITCQTTKRTHIWVNEWMTPPDKRFLSCPGRAPLCRPNSGDCFRTFLPSRNSGPWVAACHPHCLRLVLGDFLIPQPVLTTQLPQPDAELMPLLLLHFEKYIPPFIPSFQKCKHHF